MCLSYTSTDEITDVYQNVKHDSSYYSKQKFYDRVNILA